MLKKSLTAWCPLPCQGLYADVQYTDGSPVQENGVEKDRNKFFELAQEYEMYKHNYAINIEFDPNKPNLSK